MGKTFIIFGFIFILFCGIILTLYFFYEKPAQTEIKIEYKNISLKMLDGNNQVSTSFVILLDSSTIPYKFGNTTSQDYLLVKIPKNRTFSLFNINLDNQSYYTNEYKNFDLINDVIRIDFKLIKIGDLNVSSQGILGINNIINLKLESNGTINFINVCFRWSAKIIDAQIFGYEETLEPKRLKNKVDKCFITHQSLNKNSMILPITYTKFGNLNEYDFIEVYIIDGDLSYNTRNSNDNYIIEDSNGKDVGMLDFYYRII